MKYNERLVADVTLGLVFISILVILALYCAKVIQGEWVSITLACMSAALLLLFIGFECTRVQSKNKLLDDVKKHLANIKIFGNRILRTLKEQEYTLFKMEKEIQQCGNQEVLDAFSALKNGNKELEECWTICKQSMEKHYRKRRVHIVAKFAENDKEFNSKTPNKELKQFLKGLERLDIVEMNNILSILVQSLDKLVDSIENFEEIIKGLEEEQAIPIKNLYRDYVGHGIGILEDLSKWIESSMDYSSCIYKVINQDMIKRASGRKSTALSIANIMIEPMSNVRLINTSS